jgi:3-phenylpropionate/cinnamic acid dioxygenase small subunit
MNAMLEPTDITTADLVERIYEEARLLDARRFDEWNALFTDDAIYWLPLQHDQPEGAEHTSHLYEDKLLRELRVQRLKSPRAFSQQPISRCQHVLQAPHIESLDASANTFVTRTAFHYSESHGDDMLMLVGTAVHRLRVQDGVLRIAHKRVNLLNRDAALPSVQLFI